MVEGNGSAPAPPWSSESEISVLGALLIDPGCIGDVRAQLKGDDFFREAHRRIFNAVVARHERDAGTDLLLVNEELGEGSAAVGGLMYLAELVDAVPTSANVLYHARVIVEHARRRRTLIALRSGQALLYEREKPLPLAVAEAQRLLAEAAQQIVLDAGKRVVSLAEVLQDPELLKPPEPCIPRIAWRGRVTLYAGREKSGKSTLLSAAAAAKSAGHRFLGEIVVPGRVLYLSLEDHISDVVQRMLRFGADLNNLLLMMAPLDPFTELELAVREAKPDLVVVDTLAAFTERMELDPGRSTDWTPIMANFERIARGNDAAMVILHHARKSDGKYRDSSAIGARVDMILEMGDGEEEGAVAGVRKVKAKGRWVAQDFAVEYVEPEEHQEFPAYFRLAQSGELGLEARILTWIQHNPGTLKRDIRDHVRGKNGDIDAAIFRLLQNRTIRKEDGPRRATHFFVADENEGHGRGHSENNEATRDSGLNENQGHTQGAVRGTVESGARSDGLPF